MKQLLLGNAALARGLYEAGCSVVSSYPGTPSTEVTEEAAKYDEIYCEWAPNEKVAMEVAFGASLAGKRSFCGMKHVGLNVAADPLFTLSYTGVTGGIVICVADDAGMHSSQNEQDSRHYAKSAKTLDRVFRPIRRKRWNSPNARLNCRKNTIRRSSSNVHPCGAFPERGGIGRTRTARIIPYEKNIAKYVMMPGNAKRRHPVVEERMKKLTALAETTDLNREEMGGTELGIITSSTCYQYVKEVFGDRASVLKLGMIHPLPVQRILDFAAKVDRLVVVEELDDVIEQHCKALGLSVSAKICSR